jgi:signal transduction histidine kinase
MRERAAQLGGALAITSVEPHGTRVHASLPMAVT